MRPQQQQATRAKPIYHRLDPLWRRFPFPTRPSLHVTDHGDVVQVTMARPILGRALMTTNAWIVGDTLVDTGLADTADELVALCRARGVTRALLTHHHEDHAGGAASLLAAGIPVHASALTRALVSRRLPIPFYQHLVWGASRPASLAPLAASERVGPWAVEVLAAPGHAVDQVVFWAPESRTLLSGDAFIHERVRVFRADEDFSATLETARALADLPVDRLLCGHHPRLQGGQASLRAKLGWLEELAATIHAWHADGLDLDDITRRFAREHRGGGLFELLTAGDAGFRNLARAVLHGPVVRPEVAAALPGLATADTNVLGPGAATRAPGGARRVRRP